MFFSCQFFNQAMPDPLRINDLMHAYILYPFSERAPKSKFDDLWTNCPVVEGNEGEGPNSPSWD